MVMRASKESGLTDHRIKSHNASNEVVKVHVAVFVAVAADDQLVELVVQWETCKRTATVQDLVDPATFSVCGGQQRVELDLQP